MKPHFMTSDNANYYPANKLAVELCGDMRKVSLSVDDIVMLRIRGHDCRLTNGMPIGVVDLCV